MKLTKPLDTIYAECWRVARPVTVEALFAACQAEGKTEILLLEGVQPLTKEYLQTWLEEEQSQQVSPRAFIHEED